MPLSHLSRLSPLLSPLLSRLPARTIRRMASSASTNDLDRHTKTVNTAPGVTLAPAQQTAVASVLDLFAGLATKKKLALWTVSAAPPRAPLTRQDEAVFEDPLAHAVGRKQFEAQWYGLAKAFSAIDLLSHSVTSAGNPIEVETRIRYTVKGLGTSKEIASTVAVELGRGPDAERIVAVRDRWGGGELPDGPFAMVSLRRVAGRADVRSSGARQTPSSSRGWSACPGARPRRRVRPRRAGSSSHVHLIIDCDFIAHADSATSRVRDEAAMKLQVPSNPSAPSPACAVHPSTPCTVHPPA
jgi:hypothetical protein